MGYAPTPVMDRLMAKVMKTETCWMWTGSVDATGYGRIGMKKHQAPALVHRVVYEHHHGEIPSGLEVDHLCNVRICVNPAHLEAVTTFENAQRRVERRRQREHSVAD